AYNRDLQEDKEPLFDAFDTVTSCLELAGIVVSGAKLQEDRIAARMNEGFLDATTLMEYLIDRGVPQRTGHEIVGKLVALCEQRNCPLVDLTDADFSVASSLIGPDVREWLGVENAIKAFRSYGSTGPKEVERQLSRWKNTLNAV